MFRLFRVPIWNLKVWSAARVARAMSGGAGLEDLVSAIISTSPSLTIDSKTELFCSHYGNLQSEERHDFLRHLAFNHAVDHAAVENMALSFLAAKEKGEQSQLRAEDRLRLALAPRYQALFSRIGRLRHGVKFLADLRADIIGATGANTDPQDTSRLRSLNSNLRELLVQMFSVGTLHLERITWDSPCGLLQKVLEYEAVHPVRDWADLKARVGPYRRCYVFTHGAMPGEPLVVLHTALCGDIAASIQSIVMTSRAGRLQSEGDITRARALQGEDPALVKAAIFYSISSTQPGLQGIELGNQLIKRVVQEVRAEFPHLSQFSTLSPVPGFRDWLMDTLNKGPPSLLSRSELVTVQQLLARSQSWVKEPELADQLRLPLLRLCAHYLYREKHRRFALNNVANFHLRNGAVLWRLNWMADLSPRGLSNSCSIMVNYRYYLEQTEENSHRYLQDFHIAASEPFLELLPPLSNL